MLKERPMSAQPTGFVESPYRSRRARRASCHVADCSNVPPNRASDDSRCLGAPKVICVPRRPTHSLGTLRGLDRSFPTLGGVLSEVRSLPDVASGYRARRSFTSGKPRSRRISGLAVRSGSRTAPPPCNWPSRPAVSGLAMKSSPRPTRSSRPRSPSRIAGRFRSSSTSTRRTFNLDSERVEAADHAADEGDPAGPPLPPGRDGRAHGHRRAPAALW